MQTLTHIPATITEERFLRVWTCYDHQIVRRTVDTEKYFEDIDVPSDIAASDHSGIVSLLKDCLRGRSSVILAYQIVHMQFIEDDRSRWGHKNQLTEKLLRTEGKKTFVYTDRFGCPEMTLAQLEKDVNWMSEKSKNPTEEYEQEARRRRITFYTKEAYLELEQKNLGKDTKLLKLGPATYVIVSDAIEYRPVEGLNPEPER